MTSAFVYGMLLHPKILKSVLNNDASHLQICLAILTGYTRFKVKNANFPAILPAERSKSLLGRELALEETSVRGTLVVGLTAEDIAALDELESNHDARIQFPSMYERLPVLVHPLGPFMPVPADAAMTNCEAVEESLITTTLPSPATTNEQTQPIETQAYVWCMEDSELETELWSFDEYLRDNGWIWT